MAENATKCSAADGVTQTFDFCHGTPLMVRAVDFNAMHAECQKLRKDAERYRWLRDRALQELQFDHTAHEALIGIFVPCEWSDEPALDDAVDAGMAELVLPNVELSWP